MCCHSENHTMFQINRIKCHTKIQSEQVLFFSTMKTFVINNESYSHNKAILFHVNYLF